MFDYKKFLKYNIKSDHINKNKLLNDNSNIYFNCVKNGGTQKIFTELDKEKLKDFLHNSKSDWNYIMPMDFYTKYYKLNQDYFLIDLRKKEDFDEFHIKNAVNIYWLDLLNEENLKIIPKDKKIFLICYLGHTSSQALVLLKLLGYDVTSIKFGYGISPVVGVPVAGWLNYNFPTIKKCDLVK